MPPSNDGWDNVPANPPSGVVHWPTMSFPLPPPPPLQPAQLVSSIASHAHSVQLPKNYKSLSIEPQPSKGKRPTISVSSDSSETSSYTIKSLPSKLEDDVRKITFDDMHPEVSKVEEKKYVDADLLKHRVALSEGSRQRESTSNIKYYF
jgi:hypothetical protein